MTNQRNGTLYTGVTSNLVQRIYQHKNGLTPGFADRYGCKKLVYYEDFSEIDLAIRREKRLKKWERKWKLELIEKQNPQWLDLYDKIYC